MVVMPKDQKSLEWIGLMLAELNDRTQGYTKADGTRVLGYNRLDDYYSGRQGRRFIATGYRELFTAAFEFYCENVCRIVVDTVEQRLDIDGFRFPGPSTDNATATDPAAWTIWQDNGLDARSQMAHVEAIVKSVSYALVSPFTSERVGPDQRSPRITLEKPSQAIVATKPGGTERIVGLKTWSDAVDGRRYVTLYYPDRIEKFQSLGRSWANQYARGFTEVGGWERRIVPGESWPLEHTLGVVPLVPLVNHPRLGEGLWAGIEGESDIADIVAVQDSINFLALNGIVTSDKAAFPQKWATGIEIPVDPKTNKQSPAFQPDIDSIIFSRAPDAKFGNFDVAELKQTDDAIKGKLGMVALMAQIPIANFIPQTGQPASGDAREAAEIGLTKKAERKHRHFGEGWEEVIRLAFRQMGDARADDTACETRWRPAGSEPTASKIDALTKERQTLHVPLETLWERAGYSPTQRATFRAMLEGERDWLNSSPVKTTQPDALPEPDAKPVVEPVAPTPVVRAFGRDPGGIPTITRRAG